MNIGERILFEDNHIIVVNKLASEIVQGDKTGDIPLSNTVKDYLKTKYDKPGEVYLGVVHRLDRPVSGAVIFARTSKALSRLNNMLKEHKIEKTYWAVVKDPPPNESGRLTHFLHRNEKQNKSYVFDIDGANRQKAELDYRQLAVSDNYCLLEVKLLTGRHHQIRAQLAFIGCPIKGDLKYGFPRSNPGGFIHLHARKISFIHPVKEELITLVASVPSDPVWDFFQNKVIVK
jgi:23S rRNA pseudouridine1911/1915/1917 synthase